MNGMQSSIIEDLLVQADGALIVRKFGQQEG